MFSPTNSTTCFVCITMGCLCLCVLNLLLYRTPGSGVSPQSSLQCHNLFSLFSLSKPYFPRTLCSVLCVYCAVQFFQFFHVVSFLLSLSAHYYSTLQGSVKLCVYNTGFGLHFTHKRESSVCLSSPPSGVDTNPIPSSHIKSLPKRFTGQL